MINKYEIKPEMQKRLNNDYMYHSPKEDQLDRYLLIREAAKTFAEIIVRNSPPSREQSVALTELDHVVMMSNAAIARNE